MLFGLIKLAVWALGAYVVWSLWKNTGSLTTKLIAVALIVWLVVRLVW